MAGFYGGPKGSSFEIKKIYDSYESLKKAAENFQGENLNLGDWVTIDYPETSGFNMFLGYHSSLWQVCSTIDFPNWQQDSQKNEKIKDTNLFFRLINKGFGEGYTGQNINVAMGGNASTVKALLQK